MKMFVFGSSLTSSYWNGAATYYRGIYKNLHHAGHSITFAEPDIYKRQQHRDSGKIDYATVRVYQTPHDLDRMLAEASEADLIIKHSGVGADDDWLENEVLRLRSDKKKVAYWDVDAPATLARVQLNRSDSFRELVPRYDFIFTYGGGPPVIEQYGRLGARNCFPIYNGLDPDTHYPVVPEVDLACDLAFVGHRLPDREHRVNEFFFAAAELAPELSFVLGGEGWGSRPLPSNVRWIGHVSSTDHNRINCSARMVLNINRQSMAEVGFSPPTRVFEAAGAGACVITDAWDGIDQFFTPEKEILVASSAEKVIGYLREISTQQARQIGAAMRARALSDHTYNLRALEFQAALQTASSEGLSETGPLAHSHA
jgi:spore maturation protein CgeB